MKKMMEDVYGRELRWLRGLRGSDKVRLAYALVGVSLFLVCSDSDLLTAFLLLVNASVGVALCRGIDGNGLEE